MIVRVVQPEALRKSAVVDLMIFFDVTYMKRVEVAVNTTVHCWTPGLSGGRAPLRAASWGHLLVTGSAWNVHWVRKSSLLVVFIPLIQKVKEIFLQPKKKLRRITCIPCRNDNLLIIPLLSDFFLY